MLFSKACHLAQGYSSSSAQRATNDRGRVEETGCAAVQGLGPLHDTPTRCRATCLSIIYNYDYYTADTFFYIYVLLHVMLCRATHSSLSSYQAKLNLNIYKDRSHTITKHDLYPTEDI